MYRSDHRIKLPDTDAAGILFFANYIKLAHDVYEEFIAALGFSLKFIINDADYFLLIAHAEADYKKSLKLGDEYSVELVVDNIGKTSFILKYVFKNKDGDISAIVKTVHVTVDKKSNKPIRLDQELITKLQSYTQ